MRALAKDPLTASPLPRKSLHALHLNPGAREQAAAVTRPLSPAGCPRSPILCRIAA